MTDSSNLLDYKGLKIDPVIFTQGFVPGCNIAVCRGQCCDYGVYVDKDFKETILGYEKEIVDVMCDEQPKNTDAWFEKEIEKDPDFPSGFAIGTEVYVTPEGKQKCVFKDSSNYCSLQVAAVKMGLHKWAIKPLHSILYPLTIVDNTLTYDDSHSGKMDYCGLHHPENFTQTVFEAMTEELIYVLGRDGYEFLNTHFKQNYKSQTEYSQTKTA